MIIFNTMTNIYSPINEYGFTYEEWLYSDLTANLMLLKRWGIYNIL